MIKYCHINSGRSSLFTDGTITMLLPSKENLIKMFNNFKSEVYIDIGVSFLHPKDNFNRKKGREVSAENMAKGESKYCFLKNIENRNGRWIFHFTTLVPDTRPSRSKFMKLDFGVTMCEKSDNTRLEYCCFVE